MAAISLQDKKVLLFATLAGAGANATLAGLTLEQVSFSVFPIIACILAFYCMLDEYQSRALDGDIPLLTGTSFLVGALGYSVFIRVAFPEIGNNFLPLMVCMAIIFYMCHKMGLFSK
jgi:hypothetical protein